MLTQKKKLYAEGILAGKNRKQSAIDAGYSERSAEMQGSRLGKDKDVIAYIEAKQTGRSLAEVLNKHGGSLGEGTDKSTEARHESATSQLITDRVTINGQEYVDPLRYLEIVMLNEMEDVRNRVNAAKKLAEVAFPKTPVNPKGKSKDIDKPSKFSSAPPPSFKVVK